VANGLPGRAVAVSLMEATATNTKRRGVIALFIASTVFGSCQAGYGWREYDDFGCIDSNFSNLLR